VKGIWVVPTPVAKSKSRFGLRRRRAEKAYTDEEDNEGCCSRIVSFFCDLFSPR